MRWFYCTMRLFSARTTFVPEILLRFSIEAFLPEIILKRFDRMGESDHFSIFVLDVLVVGGEGKDETGKCTAITVLFFISLILIRLNAIII